MNTHDNEALVKRHLEIWNETNPAKRNALMTETYADAIEMVDRHFIAIGYKEINGFVNNLHERKSGSQFTDLRQIDTHHNIARLYWQFGTKEKPDAVTGMDLFVIENGKVQKLYVFVDGPE